MTDKQKDLERILALEYTWQKCRVDFFGDEKRDKAIHDAYDEADRKLTQIAPEMASLIRTLTTENAALEARVKELEFDIVTTTRSRILWKNTAESHTMSIVELEADKRKAVEERDMWKMRYDCLAMADGARLLQERDRLRGAIQEYVDAFITQHDGEIEVCGHAPKKVSTRHTVNYGAFNKLKAALQGAEENRNDKQ